MEDTDPEFARVGDHARDGLVADGKQEGDRHGAGEDEGGREEESATRQKFRKKLREGELDDKEIEIDVQDQGGGASFEKVKDILEKIKQKRKFEYL